MTRHIYLIRHGALALPSPGRRCIGRTDYDLSPEGAQQVLALRSYFRDHPVSHVFSSPLQRCIHSAHLIFDHPPQIVDDLREVDMGQWDGLLFQDIQARWPALYAARGESFYHTAAPEGESFAEAGTRFAAAVTQILADHAGDIAIVAHAGVIRTLLCPLLEVEPDQLRTIAQDYGCINLLEQADGRLRVIRSGFRPEQQEELHP